MSQDQQTYQRGTQAALVGLLVQLALTVGVALIGLWSESPAVMAAFWHFAGGLLIWLVLVLVYHQHKIERGEALEAERLARSDASAAVLFEEAADDLDLARRRLQKLYKFGLGAVSIATALYLIAVGGALYYFNQQVSEAGKLAALALGVKALDNPLILIFLVAVPGFIAFIVARYVSGMTKVKEWQLLRGGASYMMGNMFVSVLLFVGALFANFGNFKILGLMALIIPGLMVLIGVEIGLTMVLSAYRPRRPGEIARPAFDSRVLGLLTAPESLTDIISEAINYQFGFEISRSWFYQLLGKSFIGLVAVGVVMLLLVSSLVLVEPHQEAVITRNGALVAIRGPGLSLKWPWPVGRAEHYDVERVHAVTVGSGKAKDLQVPILWTGSHTEEDEQYMLTAAGAQPGGTGRRQAAAAAEDEGPENAGMALAAAEVVVQYRIRDLAEFIMATGMPAGSDADTGASRPHPRLTAMADQEVNAYFVSHTLDHLLGDGRLSAGETLQANIQRRADEAELGVDIVLVSVTGIHPPSKSEVAAAFHEVIGATQEKESAIEEARRDAIGTLAAVAGSHEHGLRISDAIEANQSPQAIESLLMEAGGEAASRIADARAYRWQRAITERAKAERFKYELAAYNAAPKLYRARAYLDVVADSLNSSRKIIVTADQAEAPVWRLDFKDAESALQNILGND